MWHMGDGWGWWMVFGWIWMVAFWALIIWAIMSLTRRPTDRRFERSTTELTPLEILEQRYARGELTDEQFDAMRRRLTASGSAAGGRTTTELDAV